MNSRNVICMAMASAASVFAGGNVSEQPVKHPNVIIVLSDDHGYGDLSLTGNPLLKTPKLDQFARESIRLENFHSNLVCTPTRASIMTGRYAERVGAWHCQAGRDMLRESETTMADVFRRNGYRTGIFGKWHLGSNYPYRPIDRGFEEWFGASVSGVGHAGDFWGNDRVNDTYQYNAVRETKPHEGFETDILFDEAISFIRKNKTERFFVYLPTYAGHAPSSVPDPKWTEPYRKSGAPADFFATMANFDYNFGRLREFLTQEGLAHNTILVFLGDNGAWQGAQFYNAGMRGQKGTAYEGGHRVFCAIGWPGGRLAQHAAINRLTSCMDFLPTFIDLCGLKLAQPIKFDGTSIRPLLENPATAWPDRTLIAGFFSTHPYAVMTDRWRLVLGKGVGEAKLFDISADPGQKQDLGEKNPQMVQQLHSAFITYQASVQPETKDWSARPIIGTPEQPVTELNCADWYKVSGSGPYDQGSVAAGWREPGTWHVRFAEKGDYQFQVRRWPVEAEAPITGVPAAKNPDAWTGNARITGTLYGNRQARALANIVAAKITVGGTTQEKPVPSDAKCVTFILPMAAGAADISVVFLDNVGKTVCGAYYVYVNKPQLK
jgi:arylsulfatase A-like enzyme